MRIFKRFGLAASYITSIPFTALDPAQVSAEGASSSSMDLLDGLSKYLPVVGALVGVFLSAITLLLLHFGVGSLLVALIVTIAWLFVTGGLHMDGLMDTTDGIASHRSRDKMLEIMSDPRVGNFGSLSGTLALMTKFASIASMPLNPVPPLLVILLLTPAWARWCEAFAIGAFKYAKPDGKGKIWHDTTRFPQDVVRAIAVPLFLTCICCYFGYWVALLCAGCATFSGLSAAIWLNKKIGGQTGDTYGAVVEIAEAGSLLGCALLLQTGIM